MMKKTTFVTRGDVYTTSDELPNLGDLAILNCEVTRDIIKKGSTDSLHIFKYDENCAAFSDEYDFIKVKINK